ncbi:TonB-dependent copper receptor [Paraferrimonas haliotis]|uniref:TonB-dependent copper receptor n=1 Tax=Paraferrimonas haliotis TaxID=2013866 RepID=UPI000BA8F3DB|nr:TonB-dependent copper receptor [Paraferrimonas haliotis]
MINRTIAFLPISYLAIAPVLANEEPNRCSYELSCDEVIVVTGAKIAADSSITIDPQKPHQPIPSFDGSGLLKSIAGINVTRKGGAGGDISLRGLAGSRISIVNDGQHSSGTCGGRMDPPTNYVVPEAFDQVVVIKGPQSVRYGPVGSAGTVLFNKDRSMFYQPQTQGSLALTRGSFDRADYLIDIKTGTKDYYITMNANASESDHFKDGNGDAVQSRYDRNFFDAAVAYAPTTDSILEVSHKRARGSAEYADRANKASQINSDSWQLYANQEWTQSWVNNSELQLYWNENDHIMDQFDKASDTPLFGSNPKRTTVGATATNELEFSNNVLAWIGIDVMDSVMDTRRGASIDEIQMQTFERIYQMTNLGVFMESRYELSPNNALEYGIRVDHQDTDILGSWAINSSKPNKHTNLVSGFTRWEHQGLNQDSWTIGVGHSQRPADYWEINKVGRTLTLADEKTTQLDIGWTASGELPMSISGYLGSIKDYILIDNTQPIKARNINARIAGIEASTSYQIATHWDVAATFSYSYGQNHSDNTPLGQISPMETNISISYTLPTLEYSLLWRVVAKQNRVTVGHGNTVGVDIAESPGFGVLSMNASWKPTPAILVSFGLDNLLNKTYAEHISKTGAQNDLLPDDQKSIRVNETGRNAWVRASYRF